MHVRGPWTPGFTRGEPGLQGHYTPGFTLGDPIQSAGVARVTHSSSPDWAVGDVLTGRLPWQVGAPSHAFPHHHPLREVAGTAPARLPGERRDGRAAASMASVCTTLLLHP